MRITLPGWIWHRKCAIAVGDCPCGMPAFELASEPTFLRNKEYAHAVERQLLHETDGIGEIAGDTGGVIDQQHIKGEGASVRRGQGWLNPGTLETRTRQRCVGTHVCI